MSKSGERSIIFKEFLFDQEKQKAVVYVVVAEKNLTQHVWIAIIKVQKGWHICLVDGCPIFPTIGSKRALELVYERVIGK